MASLCPDKPKAGRPSAYDPKYCDEIIKFLANGYSVKSFAAKIGVNRDTVYSWAKNNPEFDNAKEIGIAKAALFWETMLIEFAKSGKGNAAAIIFALKNRAADEWSDKNVTEHTGKDGGAIQFDLTSEQRAKALAAFLAKKKSS